MSAKNTGPTLQKRFKRVAVIDLPQTSSAKEMLSRIKQIIPDAFDGDKLNLARVKELFGDAVADEKENFRLQWNGKSQAYKNLQQPSDAILIPDPQRSLHWDNAGHIFIEGDNREVLKLLQPAYAGKVNMIYIDPPYNTGSDLFIYTDKFSGNKQLKKNVNNITAAGVHSQWLSMMLPGLVLSRNLLADDGFIFLSIDDNELASLKLLMDEVYGEENFRNIFLVRRYDKNINTQFLKKGLKSFNTGAEYVLAYSKNPLTKMNPVFREAPDDRKENGYWKGFWSDAERKTMQYELLGVNIDKGQWKWQETVAQEAVKNYKDYVKGFSGKMTLEEYWKKTGGEKKFIRRMPAGKGKNKGVEHWIAPNDKILRNTLWQDVFASKSPQGFDVPFNNPKNPELIKLLIEVAVGHLNEGIVLDFFAGSGTTAHAVAEHNFQKNTLLQSISVQLAEPIDKKQDAYAKGHRFISDITAKRIGDVCEHYNKKNKSGFRAFRLTRGIDKDISQTNSRKADAAQILLWSVLLKKGLPLSTKITEYKIAGAVICFVESLNTIILLNKFTAAMQKKITALKPERVCYTDAVFTGNAAVKEPAIKEGKRLGTKYEQV